MWQIFILIASMAISNATRPIPKNAKPAGFGDFKIPTAEKGRPIGVLFGSAEIPSPNCVFYGDLGVKPIRKSA